MLFNVIWDIIIFIITLSTLIMVHEFGHFYVARYFNIYIECFSIGFGKKILQYRDKYGTSFVIRLIPLGGYIKMPDNHHITTNQIKYINKYKLLYFNHLVFLKKFLIILSGPLFNLIFAIMIYWSIFFIGLPIHKPIIGEIYYSSLADTAGLTPNTIIKKINGIKTSDWDTVNTILIQNVHKDFIDLEVSNIYSDILSKKKIILTKNFIKNNKNNLITSLGILPKGFIIYPIITQIITQSPAEKAKFYVGDEIVKIQNKNFTNWYNFQKIISNNINKSILITVKRNKKNINIILNPNKEYLYNKKNGFIGLIPQILHYRDNTGLTIYKYNIYQSFIKAISKTYILIKLMLVIIANLFHGSISFHSINGPISIARNAGILSRDNYLYYFMFLALISINLGIINLLPIPVLDGGQISFLLYTKITGHKLSKRTQELIYNISLIFLFLIMGIALINDFSQL
ncbi:RIP metalloprotease RseP [Enterobacteriaceae endosymbiont of Plateumaris consimilis]|uniref:RIP metalloprotease RseP n=1 Tax=Enterobacteriaceae endosymbiont of Plateumaris consimilis TaxID=2675794 RepID=UPI0014491F48|nr:RIP metalloprotease RseP [Enterobacteriaceae endosymbiont of Plateumaris consimilis]QJC28638.1 RIP metalloprotease RseP [Enterobacteriaceae endosymbiont of Plateumaris consimilis]